MDDETIRIVIKINSGASPELYEDLARLPQRKRAERVRALATIPFWSRGGRANPLAIMNPPETQQVENIVQEEPRTISKQRKSSLAGVMRKVQEDGVK